MIGKPEWFAPRKFGWGLGLRTKKGVAYIVVAAALVSFAFSLPLPLEQRTLLAGCILAVFLADVLHIMTSVYSKLDEREQRHQAMAERNSSFSAVAVLAAYIVYLALTSEQNAVGMQEKLAVPITVLLAMALAKGTTLIYLEKRS